jgi:hypothetical protein
LATAEKEAVDAEIGMVLHARRHFFTQADQRCADLQIRAHLENITQLARHVTTGAPPL